MKPSQTIRINDTEYCPTSDLIEGAKLLEQKIEKQAQRIAILQKEISKLEHVQILLDCCPKSFIPFIKDIATSLKDVD